MLYYGNAADYALFINVGGSHAVLGGGPKVRYSTGGWHFEPPREQGSPNGVMDEFLKKKVPCLHLLRIDEINERYGIVPSEVDGE